MRIVEFCRLSILLSVVFSSLGFAQSNKILIVTSETTVFRYETIATEFKNVLQQNAYQTIEFGLDARTNSEATLKQLIQQENPALIYCIGSQAYSLVHALGVNKKLLFSGAINWRRLELGEGVYGIANELSSAQEVSLLHYFFPKIKRIGILYNDEFNREYVESIKKEALASGINVIGKPVSDVQEINEALIEVMPQVDMYWIIPDPIVLKDKDSVRQIFQAAQQYNKPVYAYSDVYIEQGAVLSISADIATIGRQAASLALMADQGKVPSGTVQSPAGSTVTLNKCVLDTLKLQINQDALDSINNVVGCKK